MPARKFFILIYKAATALVLIFFMDKILLARLRNQNQRKHGEKQSVQEKGQLCAQCQKSIARVRIDYLAHNHQESFYFCQSCAQDFILTKRETFKSV